MRRSWSLAALLSLSALAAIQSSRALAEDVADFYRAKTLEIMVGTGPGGGYDANARLVARHIGRFIPGGPKVIVSNVPGGGGITAANKLFNISPRDGLSIGTFSNALLTLPLISPSAVRFEANKLTWIGSLAREEGLCIASKASNVATWDELARKEIIAGTTAPGTTTHVYAALLVNLFSARLRLVSGYPDGSSVVLAFTRGEVHALCQTYSSLNVLHPEWLAQRQVNPIVVIGVNRIPALKDVPAIMEFTRSDSERDIVRILAAPTAAGRPYAAPPGIPEDRAAALRAAFKQMSEDAEFLADASQARIEVQIMSGVDISRLLEGISRTEKSVIDQVRRIVDPASGK